MNSLRLKNFKAYRDEFDELFENGHLSIRNNFLLYGDNGSGKSSIYEAIKIIFFREKLENLIDEADTPEDTENNKRDFWDKYKNKITNIPFEIKINKKDYTDFSVENHQLFMIQIDELCITNEIKFDKFLEKFDFDIVNIIQFCSDNYSEIEINVNTMLKDTFREKDIEITINKEDNYSLIIKDTKRNLESKDEINKYFNEAKINLILLLLLFESIKKAQNNSKKRILVLDDFITSLDVANRTFLMRYIFDNFSEFQILIFTHNVYFYNLIMYLVNDIYTQDIKLNRSKWKFANLYEIENKHKIYINPSNKKRLELSVLENKLNSLTNENSESIGNEFRQKFEILLYEFSKILMIGGVEETKNILEILIKQKKLYFYKDGNELKGSLELLQEIEKVIDSGTTNIDDIKSVFEKYTITDFNIIHQTLRDLKLFQKVQLHPLSHGQIAQSNFTIKEAKESLFLLKKLEKSIFDLINKQVN